MARLQIEIPSYGGMDGGLGQFLQEPHGVTSQRSAFFIVTALKTSNLT
jgi:hypothetical protein